MCFVRDFTSKLDHNDGEADRQCIWTVSPGSLLVGLKTASGNRRFSKQANATAFLQWRSWLRGGDLTQLSMRVGPCLHPRGTLAIQSLRLASTIPGLVSVLCSATSTELGWTKPEHPWACSRSSCDTRTFPPLWASMEMPRPWQNAKPIGQSCNAS
jgi:hypothetical protein